MNCPRCNAVVDPQVKFCPACGAALAAGAANPPAALSPRSAAQPDEPVEGERQLWEGGYSSKAMIGVWILLALVSVGIVAAAVLAPIDGIGGVSAWSIAAIVIVVLWAIGGIAFLWKKFDYRYTLTTQRLIHRHGILSRTTDRVELIDVDDITFKQGLVERMLGVGTIHVRSSDATHPELTLRGIDEVQRVSDLMDDARRKERRRRGIHIENI